MLDLFKMLTRYAIIAYFSQMGLSGETLEAVVGVGVTLVTILWSLHSNGYIERFKLWLSSGK